MARVDFKDSSKYTLVNNTAIFPENTEVISIMWDLSDVQTPEGFGSIRNYWVTLVDGDGYTVYTRVKDVDTTSIDFNVVDYNGYSGNSYDFKFTVCALDIYGKRSENVSSYVFKFNVFSVGNASLSLLSEHNNKICYSDSNYNIILDFKGSPNNSNNDKRYTAEIRDSMNLDPYGWCKIYNHEYALDRGKIVVVGTKDTAPENDAYIILKEIRENMFSTAENSTGYIGVYLTNEYGSKNSIGASIMINLPYLPASADNITINTNKKVADTAYYMSGYPVTINFTEGKDQYGISKPTHYFHYAIVDTNVTDVPNDSQFRSSDAYNGFKLDIPAQNKQKKMYYKIETRLHSLSSFTDVGSIILDYYNRPSVAITHLNRDETRLTFKVEISKNSSIPEGTLRITSVTYNYLYESTDYTYNASIPTDATSTHTTWNATLDLTRGSSTDEAKEKAKAAKWVMYVKVYDTFLGTNDPTIRNTQIYTYIPVMTFTKYGVGINYVPEYKDKNYKLTIGGLSQFKENSHFHNGISIHKKLDLYDLYPESGDLDFTNRDDYLNAVHNGRLANDTKIRFSNFNGVNNTNYDYGADVYVLNDRLAIDYTGSDGKKVTEKFITSSDLLINGATTAYPNSSNSSNRGEKTKSIMFKSGSSYYKIFSAIIPFNLLEKDENYSSDYVYTCNYPIYYINPTIRYIRYNNSSRFIRAIFDNPTVTATINSSDTHMFYTTKLNQDGTDFQLPSVSVFANLVEEGHGWIFEYGYINIVAQGFCYLIDTDDTYGNIPCEGTEIYRENKDYYSNIEKYVKDKYGDYS